MTSLKDHYDQLKSDLVNIRRSSRLAAGLPRFFRERITLQQAEEETKRLVETRAERFLELVRSQIYERPGSPYQSLLRHAGCEFSDLATNLHRSGLEATLAKLAEEGVYLTSDEFKGKKKVTRGPISFRVSPTDFDRRETSAGITTESSGSRNSPIKTFSSLESLTLWAEGTGVFYAAHDLFSCVHAVYEPVLAGRMHFILINGKLGVPVNRWFALNVAAHGALEDRYHYLNARVVAQTGSWFGPGIARPEYLDAKDLEPIIDWTLEHLRLGKRCCIITVVSNATRIARKALEAGISLEHLTLVASGEPLTKAKKRLMEDAGARIAIRYGPGGVYGTALGCSNPGYIDEMHVPQTMFTFVEHPRPLDYGGSPIHPLMQTTTHPAAPRLLLNVENGDYATIITRDCGCPLQKVGFTQHLHTVRSFEKMTSEGMNYAGSDLFELLEDTIPSEFGGGPGDYQLVEEEDARGQTRLTLVVRPNVKELNEKKLLLRLMQGLASGSRNHRFISQIWQDAGTFRIRRELPHASPRGKVLPLHIKQKP
ncbi:MAG: hypothetical protein OEN50_09675 [Deltaproteobacteria bacterium]|nr:hypothetical protein [Deltaproteobacteria bacterium]